MKKIWILSAIILLLAAAGWVGAGLYYDGYFTNLLVKGQLYVSGTGSQTGVTNVGTFTNQGLAQLYGVRKKQVVVNSYTQFAALSGATTAGTGNSVYAINLANGNDFQFDVTAIGTSCDPTTSTGATLFKNRLTTATGVSVIAPVPTSENDGAEFRVVKIDSGATPIFLWAPQTNGVTPIAILRVANYAGGISSWQVGNATGTTPYDVSGTRLGESRTYELNYNAAVSIFQTGIVKYGPD